LPGDLPHEILIVGYGNSLRGDDGLGRRAAELLADDPRLAGARVLSQHQLTPELALDISTASVVVLIDASTEAPGAISVRQVEPTPDAGSASSHHVSPATLGALAAELYGAAAPMFVVSVGAASMDVGDGLSPDVERALPAVVEAVVAIVVEHGRR
jgi:hydrogenase maturation protease